MAISREAYKDSRFKYFGDLPEDTFEAFLSAPVIARNRVVGVINVQHRAPHQHTGSEMEVLSTVGEQVGCMLVLARMEPTAVAEANHVELVLSSGPATEALVRRPWLPVFVALLVATAVSGAETGERWRVLYSHDDLNSSLVINDFKFLTLQRGVAAGFQLDKNGKIKPATLVSNDGGQHWTLTPIKDVPSPCSSGKAPGDGWSPMTPSGAATMAAAPGRN